MMGFNLGQVTIFEFGGFITRAYKEKPILPAPPAYSDPSLPSQQFRQFISSPQSEQYFGLPEKLVPKLYDLADKDDLPMRIAIGIGAVEHITQKLDKAKEDIHLYSSLSQGLK